MKIKEIMVMTLLTRCWNLFLELDSQHPNEQKDFMEGIHKCQYVMAPVVGPLSCKLNLNC